MGGWYLVLVKIGTIRVCVLKAAASKCIFQFLYANNCLWTRFWPFISSRVSLSHSRLSVVIIGTFLTAGPIHLKFGWWVPWPKRVGPFFHFSILSLYVATRGRYWKTHYCHFQANGDSYDHQIFFVGTSDEAPSHIVLVFDLTYFSRSQRSKFKISPLVGTFQCY